MKPIYLHQYLDKMHICQITSLTLNFYTNLITLKNNMQMQEEHLVNPFDTIFSDIK